MQIRQFFPCFVVLDHTVQTVAEIIVGSFKVFRGQLLRSIALEELGGIRTTRRTPLACAHSAGRQEEELTEASKLKAAKYLLSATTAPSAEV